MGAGPAAGLVPDLTGPGAGPSVTASVSMVAPPHTSSFESVEVEVCVALPRRTWLLDVARRMPELLKKVKLLSLPPPPPLTSVPQANWRVVEFHKSLSTEVEHEVRPAPAIVPFI